TTTATATAAAGCAFAGLIACGIGRSILGSPGRNHDLGIGRCGGVHGRDSVGHVFSGNGRCQCLFFLHCNRGRNRSRGSHGSSSGHAIG
ncbi:hypothetical protein NY997_12865, partial [Escherichia coli]|uniref:hypothetical protein n=1 Tax=Escherichia coli TaxID=562 RepID=UPI0022F09E58